MLRDIIFGIVSTIHGMLPHAQVLSQQLLYSLLLLDFLFFAIQVILGSKNNVADLIMQFLKMGFFVFLLNNFVNISQAFMQSIMKLSSVTGYGLSTQVLADPMAMLEYACTDILKPLDKAVFERFGLTLPFNMSLIISVGTAELSILICFIFISLQLAIAFIEYHTSVYMGQILLPFNAFEPTQFIGSKVFATTAGHAIKLGIISMVTGIAVNIFKTNAQLPTATNIVADSFITQTYMYKLTASSLLLFLVAWQIPALASGFLGGMPNFSLAGFAQNIAAMTAGPVRALTSKFRELRNEEKKDNQLVSNLQASGFDPGRSGANAGAQSSTLNSYYNRDASNASTGKTASMAANNATSKQPLNEMLSRKN